MKNTVSRELEALINEKGVDRTALAVSAGLNESDLTQALEGRKLLKLDEIASLANAIGVPPERLVYGSEAFDGRDKKRVGAVFALLTALFVGVGAVLLFITLWDKMPSGVRTVLALLPMLAAQAIAFVLLKTAKSPTLGEEIGGVLWCAGSAGTLAMLSGALTIRAGFWACFALDAVMFLVAAFVLRSVSALTIYLGSMCALAFHYLDDKPGFAASALLFAAVLLGAVFCLVYKKSLDTYRFRTSVWMSTLGFAGIILVITGSNELIFAPVAMALSLFIYSLHRNENPDMPFSTLGTVGAVLTGIISISAMSDDIFKDRTLSVSGEAIVTALLCAALTIAAIVMLAVFGRKNKLRIGVGISCAAACPAVFAIFGHYGSGIFWAAVLLAAALALGILLIFDGVTNRSMLRMNAGIFTVAAELIFVVFDLSERQLSMASTGFILIGVGLLMLLINFIVSKKRKGESGR